MLCPYCQQARTPDASACRNCGAPAPGAFSFDGQGQTAAPAAPQSQFSNNRTSNIFKPGNTRNSGSASQFSSSAWGAPSSAPMPGGSLNGGFPAQEIPLSRPPSGSLNGMFPIQETPFSRPSSGSLNGTFPGQETLSARRPSGALLGPVDQPAQSLLPAIYQGDANMRQPTMALQLLPQEIADHIPEQTLGAPVEIVSVPPTWTTPRPLIPRRRAINGLLSVLIVSLLICGGIGYVLQSNGVLSGLTQFVTGNKPLANIKPSPTAVIPDPPDDTTGPAADVIPSALLGAQTATTGEGNVYIPSGMRVFQPGQKIYLVATFAQPVDGTVTIKWYMNKQPQAYQTTATAVTKAKLRGILASTAYSIPASGSVSIYWNDQIAQTLYFAVR